MGHSDTGSNKNDLHRLTDPEWKRAEAFRMTGIYGRAALYFRNVWGDNGNVEAGWRYAHCMRKTGVLDTALKLLKELVKENPGHEEITEELVWCLYEAKVVRAKEEGNAQKIISSAKEMVAAGAEGNALKLAVFAVLSAAKTKGHWNQVCHWCDLLNPDELSSQHRVYKDKSIPSDQERWYFGKLKALVKMEDWHLARDVSEQACQRFPGNEHFQRWRAQSLAGMGFLEEAVSVLESLGGNLPWYALADLAKYSLELEQVEKAWVLSQRAGRLPGPVSAKVNLWEQMARIALSLDLREAAQFHLALSLRVREEKSWPFRPHHRSFIAQVWPDGRERELINQPSRKLLSECKKYWVDVRKKMSEKSTAHPSTSQLIEGWVMGWDEKRPFAFIEPCDGGEQIFVLTKDLPEESRKNRAPIVFQTILQFDKRKNRQSPRAVSIRPRDED